MDKVRTGQPEPQPDTLEIINAEITASLARQADSGARIDTKAIILVGYAGAASSFLATRHAQPILAGLAYLAYGTAASFGIWAYAVRLYLDAPNPLQLFNGYHTQTKTATLAALAATRVEAFDKNASTYNQKARLWLISLITLTLGATFMILALTSPYW